MRWRLYRVLCCVTLCTQADKLEEEDLLIFNLEVPVHRHSG
jgi:hypothetical protein